MVEAPETIEWLYNQNKSVLVDRIGRLERQLAELRASGHDSFKLACMWQDQAKAAEAREARLSEALREIIEKADYGTGAGLTADSVCEQIGTIARAALSGSGAGGWRTECATEGCGKPATAYFERGGIGSHYCHDCYMRVQALPAAPTGEAK